MPAAAIGAKVRDFELIKLSLQSLSYRDAALAGKTDLLGIMARAVELRLDGIDLHGGQFESTEHGYLEELKRACLRGGLHMCYIGVSNNFGLKGPELREQVENVKSWVDVANAMGVPMVRVFGGWVPDDEGEESVWPRLIDATREVTAYARPRGIVLGLHNHNHGCIPATGAQVLRVLDEIDDPYYSHILDTGQYRGSPGASFGERGVVDPAEDFYGSIETSAPRAVHVRAKIYRIRSGEEEWLDYDRIMGILKSNSFNGWMSVVYEGQDDLDEETAVPLATTFLRNMLRRHQL